MPKSDYDPERCAEYISNVGQQLVKLVMKSIHCGKLVKPERIVGAVFVQQFGVLL
jgi:hypothetical protein